MKNVIILLALLGLSVSAASATTLAGRLGKVSAGSWLESSKTFGPQFQAPIGQASFSPEYVQAAPVKGFQPSLASTQVLEAPVRVPEPVIGQAPVVQASFGPEYVQAAPVKAQAQAPVISQAPVVHTDSFAPQQRMLVEAAPVKGFQPTLSAPVKVPQPSYARDCMTPFGCIP